MCKERVRKNNPKYVEEHRYKMITSSQESIVSFYSSVSSLATSNCVEEGRGGGWYVITKGLLHVDAPTVLLLLRIPHGGDRNYTQ